MFANKSALVKVFFSVQISREVLTNCGIKFLSKLSSRGITELIRGFGKVIYELYLPDSKKKKHYPVTGILGSNPTVHAAG